MAKTKKDKKAAKAKAPKALRASGDAVAKWTKSPLAREVLAAGLVAVAGALANNKTVQAKVKSGAKDVDDAASEAADGTSRLGTAIAAVAADAAQKLFPADGAASPKKAKAGKKGGKKRKAPAGSPTAAH